jgi:hypothetical protein
VIPRDSPFHPENERAYLAWRAAKLARAPKSVTDLIVEVRDPRALTPAERAAIVERCRVANMAIYASPCTAAAKEIPVRLGLQLGLARLDRNLLSDADGITSLAASDAPARGEYIPYTNRPLKWHTDGYYNPPERPVRAVILHCVRRAEDGGENTLLDHELAYLLLRDEDPEHIYALAEDDAMTIPPRMDEHGVARRAETGPVFSVDPASGDLHMRYTERTRSIAWKESMATLAASRRLLAILHGASPHVFRVRLESGMGLVSNNVLHNRSAFSEGSGYRRLIYRARYYDRVAGTRMGGSSTTPPRVPGAPLLEKQGIGLFPSSLRRDGAEGDGVVSGVVEASTNPAAAPPPLLEKERRTYS